MSVLSAFKGGVKRTGYALFPDQTLRLLSIRSRRTIESQVEELGLADLAREVAKVTDGRVFQGPFAGMKLNYELLPVHTAPRFLGTYEQELHRCIERLISLKPPTVLNVGCSDGFYSVGMAIRLADTVVYAADADPKSEQATAQNATLNGKTVTPVGIVKPGSFENYLKPNSALIMDCEGAEFELLNPSRAPILRQSHILVEVHPEFGTSDDLAKRFSETHSIVNLEPKPRILSDVPAGLFSPSFDVRRAMDERTGKKSWLFLETKTEIRP
jgi:hypothetical protein